MHLRTYTYCLSVRTYILDGKYVHGQLYTYYIYGIPTYIYLWYNKYACTTFCGRCIWSLIPSHICTFYLIIGKCKWKLETGKCRIMSLLWIAGHLVTSSNMWHLIVYTWHHVMLYVTSNLGIHNQNYLQPQHTQSKSQAWQPLEEGHYTSLGCVHVTQSLHVWSIAHCLQQQLQHKPVVTCMDTPHWSIL